MTLYHGGRARLGPGGLILPGQRPNPWGDTFDDKGRSVYVYATTDLATAVVYATAIRAYGRRSYVYEVEATGETFPDYQGADIKTRAPLRVIRRLDY